MLFEASALPELNPNHPNQRTPAPSRVNGTLCGSSDDDGYSRRLPTAIAHATAAIAAFTWTTVPPAKSSAPIIASHPPPQPQCPTGAATRIPHSEMNVTYAENRIRSTIDPEISAAVMMANVA